LSAASGKNGIVAALTLQTPLNAPGGASQTNETDTAKEDSRPSNKGVENEEGEEEESENSDDEQESYKKGELEEEEDEELDEEEDKEPEEDEESEEEEEINKPSRFALITTRKPRKKSYTYCHLDFIKMTVIGH